MLKKTVEYIAVLYKSAKNNVYIANCYSANIAGYGKTEDAAVENLKKSLLDVCGANEVKITVLPELKISNG